jgi:hypothetical protein
MLLNHRAYVPLLSSGEADALREKQRQALLAQGESLEGCRVWIREQAFREIFVEAYPGGICVELQDVDEEVAWSRDLQTPWTSNPPKFVARFKLGWNEGDEAHLSYIPYIQDILKAQPPAVQSKLRRLVTTLRANRAKFQPVFDINLNN